MKYDEIIDQLTENPGSCIDFIEYEADGGVMLEVRGYEVYSYVKPNEYIDPQQILDYYGNDLEEDEYRYYAYSPDVRIVIQEPTGLDGRLGPVQEIPEKYVIHINRAFYETGLQVLRIHEEIEPEIPTTAAQRKDGDYDIWT